MLDEKWVIIGAFFSLFGIYIYVRDTLQGKTKPNKVSWSIWALAPLIAFAAELKQGVGLQSLMTFMVGFGPLMVLISSFLNKKAYWKIKKLDLICGSLSILGLILWQITKVGNIAIFFCILADGLASVPTVIKSFYYPETESSTIFLSSGINATITILTISAWNFEHYAFPVYILVIDALLFALIYFKVGKIFEIKHVLNKR